jgi:hypothetical protein
MLISLRRTPARSGETALLSHPTSTRASRIRSLAFRCTQALFFYLISWRARNRQSALRLPAIHRFVSTTLISFSSQSACFYNGERLPPLGFAATLPVSRQLQPFNRQTEAHLKALRRFLSRLTPFECLKRTPHPTGFRRGHARPTTRWRSGRRIMAALSRAKPAIFAHEINLDQRATLIESWISGMAEGVLIIKRDYFRVHNQTRRLSCSNYWLYPPRATVTWLKIPYREL